MNTSNKKLPGVVGIIAIISFSALVAAQRPDPNSPRYKGVMTMEGLIRSAGDAPLQRFLDDHVSSELRATHSDEQLLRMIAQVRADFQDARSAGARPAGPYAAEIMFDPKKPGSRTSLAFELESKPPHRFTDFGYEAPRAAGAGAPNAGLVPELRAYLDGLVAKDKFSGTVLVAEDGVPLFKEAYGLASKRYDVPNRVDTKLNLGSMNKMFTGVAICQLAERGHLSFEDKISMHLPDYPNRDVRDRVTIHQLLTHTSGLGSYWNDKYDAIWTKIRTLDQLLPTFVDEPLAFEPGSEFGYSNVGPVVLGLIIERITGQSYYDYVRKNIYEPAGMLNTDCYPLDHPTPNLAIGYTNLNENYERVDGPRRNNLFDHSVKGGPAGGGYSTVEDLLRFSVALQGHKLLGPAMTDTLVTGKVSMGGGQAYAYLFGDETTNGHRHYGHNGGAPGISADFHVYPDLGYTVAVLSNYDGGASGVSNFIRTIIQREPVPADARARRSEAQDIRPSGAPYRMGAMLRHSPDGMLIDAVVPGAPSERAGLRPGDMILSLNGMSLDGDADSVFAKVFSAPDVVTLLIRRGEEDLTIKLTPERAP